MSKLSFSLVAVAGLFLLSLSAQADQLSDIKAKGALVCGTLGTAEPFSFTDTATREVQGYDVDFCRAIAKSIGVKLELKLISVAARVAELQQGRVDIVVANLGYTPERAEQIAFSNQYFASATKVAARKDSGLTGIKDLAGKKVSAVKGSTSESGTRKAVPTATTITFQDPPSAFLAMQQGKVDGFAVSEMNLIKFKAQSEATVPLVVLEPALFLEPWGIGMRKEEASMIKYVNTTLDALEQSGEAQKIFGKWLGAGTPYNMQRSFKIEPIKN